MKRGLVVLDPAEIPPGELDRRVAVLQEELAAQGLAAALFYGDVYRSGDITYLSNICLYWNESVLAVPVAGRPALLMKLSRRVHPWMRATSSLEDLRSGQDLAALAAQYLSELPPGPVGLAELDWWPGPLAEALGPAAGRDITDLGPAVRLRRQLPSPAELALLASAAQLTAASVAAGLDGSLTSHARAGLAELTARRGGAEDVSVHCHAATGEASTVEVICEYRGYWTAAARVIGDGARWAGAFGAAYRAAVAALAPGVSGQDVTAAAARAMPAGLGWRAGLLQHTDLETEGGYRSPGQAAAPAGAGSVVALRLEADLPDGTQAVAADTFYLGGTGVRRLTAPLPAAAVLPARHGQQAPA